MMPEIMLGVSQIAQSVYLLLFTFYQLLFYLLTTFVSYIGYIALNSILDYYPSLTHLSLPPPPPPPPPPNPNPNRFSSLQQQENQFEIWEIIKLWRQQNNW